MNEFKYVCEICGREFKRKKEITGSPICKGCKVKAHPDWEKIKQQKFMKYKKTVILKYGVDNASKSPEIKRKISEIAQKKYSNEDSKKAILNKRKQTNLKKYGYVSASQNPEVIKKNIKTQMENNGFIGWQNSGYQKYSENRAHSLQAELKRKKTFLKNYGKDHPMKLESFKQKAKDTYFKKTGYDHPAHNPNIIHSTKGYYYNNIHFDSSWELAYYIWLKDHDKQFIYHPEYSLEYYDEKGVLRNYYPDFLVEGKFIEIKGQQFFNEMNEPYNQYTKSYWWGKYNALLRNNVIIMRFEDIRPYLKYIKNKYGKNYLKSFKKNKQGSETIENLKR